MQESFQLLIRIFISIEEDKLLISGKHWLEMMKIIYEIDPIKASKV